MLSWALAVKEVMATNVRTKRVLRSSRGLIIIPFLSSRESLVVYQVLGLGPLVLRLRSWVLVFHLGEQRPKSEGQRPKTNTSYHPTFLHPVHPKISRTLSTRPLSSRSLLSTSASCSSSFRCSRVNVVGVIRVTDTKRSPRPRPPSAGMPLPLSRKTVPVWVPIRIFSFSSLSSVFTIMSAPSAACANVIGTAS